MYRIKEWIFVGLGVIVLLVIGILNISSKRSETSSEPSKTSQEIVIQVEGEVIKPMTFTFYQPTSYGVILLRMKAFCNEYSDLSIFYENEMIYQSTLITVPTLDKNNHYDNTHLISINQASKTELMELYQIGDKRSDRIMEYIKQQGGFETWDVFWKVVSITNEETKKRIMEQAVL